MQLTLGIKGPETGVLSSTPKKSKASCRTWSREHQVTPVFSVSSLSIKRGVMKRWDKGICKEPASSHTLRFSRTLKFVKYHFHEDLLLVCIAGVDTPFDSQIC